MVAPPSVAALQNGGCMENLIIKGIKYFPRKIKKFLAGGIEDMLARMEYRLSITEQYAKYGAGCFGINFKGQIGQDIIAYLYFQKKTDGFYIDIGANDGITGSNTWIFEQLGWKGICVEPLPDVFKKLKQNRNCDCYNVAISDKTSESVDFIMATGVEMLSGINEHMTNVHKYRIEKAHGRIEKISVKAFSFADLMAKYDGVTFIDFLSVDVEGGEMAILKNIDFKKYRFGLITVENNEETKGDGERMKKYMSEQGYGVYIDLGMDIVFVPKAPPASVGRNGA
jgi:FkbM family methyltransferase